MTRVRREGVVLRWPPKKPYLNTMRLTRVWAYEDLLYMFRRCVFA